MNSIQGMNDPALGAPLRYSKNTGHADILLHSKSADVEISETLKPLLFRMYIACEILRLGTEARYAALVYLHRYCIAIYENTGKVELPSQYVAAACLFLATKSQEEPRRLRDVINLAQVILDGIGQQDIKVISLDTEPPLLDETYWALKKKLVETEQSVLRWLGFDLFVPHPHRTVSLMIRHLPSTHQDLIFPEAARRLNDALFMVSALRHPTLALSTAAIELAHRHLGQEIEPVTREGWWRRYNVSDHEHRQAMDDLEAATAALKRA